MILKEKYWQEDITWDPRDWLRSREDIFFCTCQNVKRKSFDTVWEIIEKLQVFLSFLDFNLIFCVLYLYKLIVVKKVWNIKQFWTSFILLHQKVPILSENLIIILKIHFRYRINVFFYIYICIYIENRCMIYIYLFAYHIKYAWTLYMYISLIQSSRQSQYKGFFGPLKS